MYSLDKVFQKQRKSDFIKIYDLLGLKKSGTKSWQNENKTNSTAYDF